MKIRLLGWESRGLRCPDGRIELGKGESVPRVALIQMPNGTGKTTTLTMIRAALTGDAQDWEAEQVLNLRRHDDYARDQGKFLLTLEVDDKPLVFDLTIDFLNGCVTYRTSSPTIGGIVSGWAPPRDVRRFLTEKFANLFVFDGEYAPRLLKPKESCAEEAIDALYQLDLLDDVSQTAEAAWQRETKNRGAKTTQGLASYKNRKKGIEDRIAAVTKNRAEAKKECAETAATIKEIDKKIGGKINQANAYRDQLEQLRLQEKELEGALAQSVSEAMHVIRQPQVLHTGFAKGLVALKTNLDRAKLPETTSRQFFVELAQEALCVCGRPIGPDEKETIESHANRYLGDDVSGAVNALKLDVDSLVERGTAPSTTLETAISKLCHDDIKYHQIQTELQTLEQKALADSGEDVPKLQKLHAELTTKLQGLQDTLDEIERPWRPEDTESVVSLPSLNKQLEEIRKQISQITDTVELRLKTDIIRSLVEKAKHIARDELKRALVKECNDRLKKVLSGDPVQIERISNSLELSGQREASVGQTLAVGYTFLTTALHRGTHQFPLIVDSPAGPLDHTVRREIGEMVPQMCEQFVAFTISTEREGFLPALEASSEGKIRYITLFRKTAGTKHLLAELPTTGVQQTDDGVIVEGSDYFKKFALESEQET